MKKKSIWIYVIGIISLIIIFFIVILNRLIWGKTVTSKVGENYHKLETNGIYSPLIVFPLNDVEALSQKYYYQIKDEIFSGTCQIYLENQYTQEQYALEIERLKNLKLSYLDQTNNIYLDKENYCDVTYVAMANWTDRFEYAITLEEQNTIIYVYLQNMDQKNIDIDPKYLPQYFHDNNTTAYDATKNMTEEHRSIYSFLIGKKYIDCMDLVK